MNLQPNNREMFGQNLGEPVKPHINRENLAFKPPMVLKFRTIKCTIVMLGGQICKFLGTCKAHKSCENLPF